VIAAKRNSVAISTPYYWSEVRFYRFVLGITWRRGRKLIALGVLVPDGYSDDRALFLADGRNIQRHRQAIADYSAPRKGKLL
jgi:hypothetical protein